MARPTLTLDFGLGGSFRRAIVDSDSVVACWPLGEIASITSVRNIVEPSQYGIITGSGINMGLAVDIPEGALGLRMTGTDTVYVEVAHASELTLAGGGIDVTFLIKTSTSDATNRCIIHKQDTNSTGNGWHVSLVNGAIEFYLKVGGVAVFSFQRGSIANNAVHLVRCCYDPTGTATARIMIDGVQSGATVTSVSTLPAATTANLRIGLYANDAGQFIGTLSYMTLGTSGAHAVAATLQTTLAWTDVTSHARANRGFHLRYGIQGGGPSDRVASPGTLHFVLRNVNPATDASGYYSIGHANARAGFDLRIPVRLRLTYSATTYYKFRGFIQSVRPEPGQFGHRHSEIVAVDWMQVATETHLSGLTTQIDKAAWECFGFVTDRADQPPCATDYDITTGDFPYAFDNSQGESMSAMTELQRIAQSEQIFIYLKGDTLTGGVLRCESRLERQSRAVSASFGDESLSEIDIAHELDAMVNRCKVTVNPRSDGSTNQVLWALGSPRLLPAKSNVVIEGAYTDPSLSGERVGGQDLVTLVSGTDYAMFANGDGTGRDMTASLNVYDECGANGARFLVNNADDQDGWLTILRKRGTPLLDYDPTVSVHEDPDSIRTYGARQVSFDMPYQTDSDFADKAAIMTVNARKSPLSNVRSLKFTTATNATLLTQALQREIGDVVQVKEQVAIGTGYVRFYITQIGLEIGPTGSIACEWQLAPVNAQGGFWLLGTSVLGTDTVLGWTD